MEVSPRACNAADRVSRGGRLTRTELGWLLAQEARGAAQALRDDPAAVRPPAALTERSPRVSGIEASRALGVETPAPSSTAELEDVVELLGDLQDRTKVRRGRVDLASLLFEVAPDTRLKIQPGAGTEVYANEAELRRMLSILLAQSSARRWSPEVEIWRDTDWVRISVELGPDTPNSEVERRWLSRMAVRHGGQFELKGGRQIVALQADGVQDKQELSALRKELEQAQLLGETYARELATIIEKSEPFSEIPHHPSHASLDFQSLSRLSAALAGPLRHVFEALNQDSRQVARALGDSSPLSASLARRISAGFELATELQRFAGCSLDEEAHNVELGPLIEDALSNSQRRAARHGVFFVCEDSGAAVSCNIQPTALSMIVQSLLEQGIDATPKGGTVRVSVRAEQGGAVVRITDEGPVVPESFKDKLMLGRISPTAFGRPSGPGLLFASAAARELGCSIELEVDESGKQTTALHVSTVK